MTEEVSIASFTHLGYHKDLKSEPTYWSAADLADQGLLDTLYVLDVEQNFDIPFERIDTPVPGGKFIPRLLYLLERFAPTGFEARKWITDLFDHMTARRLDDPVIVQSFPHLHRTLSAAADAGGIPVAYASSCHPDHTRELRRRERRRLGLPPTDSDRSPVIRGYELADYIFCLSEYSKRTFVEQGINEDKLITIGPLGTDVGEYEPTRPPNDEFVVVSVANMNELKGTIYLLDAWEKADIPKGRLILCGTMTDELAEILEPRIASMDSVEHVGYVSDPQEYYAEATVFVHPSLTESFGKVIAEAMAASLPVIVTENGPTEFVDKSGKVVPIRDADAICRQLEYLHANPDEAREMGRRGREIVEQNTWRAFSSRVSEAHEAILESEL